MAYYSCPCTSPPSSKGLSSTSRGYIYIYIYSYICIYVYSYIYIYISYIIWCVYIYIYTYTQYIVYSLYSIYIYIYMLPYPSTCPPEAHRKRTPSLLIQPVEADFEIYRLLHRVSARIRVKDAQREPTVFPGLFQRTPQIFSLSLYIYIEREIHTYVHTY